MELVRRASDLDVARTEDGGEWRIEMHCIASDWHTHTHTNNGDKYFPILSINKWIAGERGAE